MLSSCPQKKNWWWIPDIQRFCITWGCDSSFSTLMLSTGSNTCNHCMKPLLWYVYWWLCVKYAGSNIAILISHFVSALLADSNQNLAFCLSRNIQSTLFPQTGLTTWSTNLSFKEEKSAEGPLPKAQSTIDLDQSAHDIQCKRNNLLFGGTIIQKGNMQADLELFTDCQNLSEDSSIMAYKVGKWKIISIWLLIVTILFWFWISNLCSVYYTDRLCEW